MEFCIFNIGFENETQTVSENSLILLRISLLCLSVLLDQ